MLTRPRPPYVPFFCRTHAEHVTHTPRAKSHQGSLPHTDPRTRGGGACALVSALVPTLRRIPMCRLLVGKPPNRTDGEADTGRWQKAHDSSWCKTVKRQGRSSPQRICTRVPRPIPQGEAPLPSSSADSRRHSLKTPKSESRGSTLSAPRTSEGALGRPLPAIAWVRSASKRHEGGRQAGSSCAPSQPPGRRGSEHTIPLPPHLPARNRGLGNRTEALWWFGHKLSASLSWGPSCAPRKFPA